MSTLEILKAAKEKIVDEKSWTQEWFAKYWDDERRVWREADATSPWATCWCSSGAIRAVLNASNFDSISDDLAIPFGFDSLGNLEEFNDSHTHAEVITLWDKAIAELDSAA